MSLSASILFVHGWTTFRNKVDYFEYLKTRPISLDTRISWSDEYLQSSLGDSFSIIRPRMPLKENARYEDWKVFFERHLAILPSPLILIGVSLGGIFLAKYLSENTLANKALSAYFICPPFDDTLPHEDLTGGFTLRNDLSWISKNTERAVFCFSEDDPVVPISHAEKYRNKLPNAEMYTFADKNGHFKVETFPEIIRMIREDTGRRTPEKCL